MSGIKAWKRISLTPAIFSVLLKYSEARSSPRFLALYTRYYITELETTFGRTNMEHGGVDRDGSLLLGFGYIEWGGVEDMVGKDKVCKSA